MEASNSLIAEISHTFITLLGAAGFILGTYFVAQGAFQYGSMIAIVQLTNSLASPIQVLTGNMGKWLGSRKVAKAFLRQCDESYLEDSRSIRIAYFEDIVFDNVSLIANEKKILEGVCLHFRRGKKYLIIGGSGSGKTSILKLILGKYDASSGQLRINGHDMTQVARDDLCGVLAVIEQNVHLFNATIRDNITLFGNYPLRDGVVDDVRLTEYIDGAEKGLDTDITENGDTVSGGEKQRISIARFLCSQKQVCLADEITSSLDSVTAKAIESLLLCCSPTLIAVSHKYDDESLRQYDEIVVIDKGRIIKQGAYHEVAQYIKGITGLNDARIEERESCLI